MRAAAPRSTNATSPPFSMPQRRRRAAGRLVCPRCDTFAADTSLLMTALYQWGAYKAQRDARLASRGLPTTHPPFPDVRLDAGAAAAAIAPVVAVKRATNRAPTDFSPPQ